ncbi:TetR/AcrR family transcriptional regulator [Pseudochrobactrum sp. MP213Fo]|uniref:TetR/AcrR family transcriptional regulator n=1 Tax=Pseudochrobactrum sp. MP213Fo TaxID=3022250 RepID=UPI003B9F1EBF
MPDSKRPPDPAAHALSPNTRHSAGQDPVKRQQILDGAQRVFMSMGFDAASMNDITREAGVSKSTIYVYFESKDELFEQLCEQHRTRLFAQVSMINGGALSSRESLIAYGTALVKLVTSDMVISAQRTILGVTERKPEIGVRFYERGPRRGLTIMLAYLEMLENEGHIQVPDMQHAVYQLAELFLAGSYRQRLFAFMPDEPTEDQIRYNVESAVNMFFAAYGTEQYKREHNHNSG